MVTDADITLIHPDYPTRIVTLNALYREHTETVAAHFTAQARARVTHEITSAFTTPDRVRPRRTGPGTVRTDFLPDWEWAALIARDGVESTALRTWRLMSEGTHTKAQVFDTSSDRAMLERMAARLHSDAVHYWVEPTPQP